MAIKKRFNYNPTIEKIAAEARAATTNEELARICENLNIADKIYLGKVDLWLAKHALSAVYRNLKRYPFLRTNMHYFGTLNGFIKNKEHLFSAINGIHNESILAIVKQTTDNMAKNCRTSFENNGLATAFNCAYGQYAMSGIIINGKSLNKKTVLSTLEYSEKSGHNPKGCKTVKSVVDHEFGHILDFQLDISCCYKYKKTIKNYDVNYLYNNLSHYCVLNNQIDDREVIAEAYSEYCNNNSPREVSKILGELIDLKYRERFSE